MYSIIRNSRFVKKKGQGFFERNNTGGLAGAATTGKPGTADSVRTLHRSGYEQSKRDLWISEKNKQRKG